MRFLIVWNMPPEKCQIHVLNLDDKQAEKARLCCCNYINTSKLPPDVDEALTWLSEHLEGRDAELDDSTDCKTVFVSGDFEVVLTGFLM